MKTVILYYTFGGATKKEAERLGEELSASVVRVREKRSRGVLGAFLPGCPQAMHRKATAILPLDVKLEEHERIVIGAPVWAAHPAPAFNTIVNLLPAGKEVELFFCSAGGETQKSKAGTIALIEKRGCRVLSYRDVQTQAQPGKLVE